jgi:hypothetical protein
MRFQETGGDYIVSFMICTLNKWFIKSRRVDDACGMYGGEMLMFVSSPVVGTMVCSFMRSCFLCIHSPSTKF